MALCGCKRLTNAVVTFPHNADQKKKDYVEVLTDYHKRGICPFGEKRDSGEWNAQLPAIDHHFMAPNTNCRNHARGEWQLIIPEHHRSRLSHMNPGFFRTIGRFCRYEALVNKRQITSLAQRFGKLGHKTVAHLHVHLQSCVPNTVQADSRDEWFFSGYKPEEDCNLRNQIPMRISGRDNECVWSNTTWDVIIHGEGHSLLHSPFPRYDITGEPVKSFCIVAQEPRSVETLSDCDWQERGYLFNILRKGFNIKGGAWMEWLPNNPQLNRHACMEIVVPNTSNNGEARGAGVVYIQG